MSVSILTLIAISIDRYYLILYPFKKKLKFKQCSILLITIWIVSCAMSVTKLYNHVILFVNDTSSARGGDPIKQCGIKNYELLDYETGVLFSTQYLLPLILIMFIYARIGYFLYFERASTSTVKPRTAKRRRVISSFLTQFVFSLTLLCLFSGSQNDTSCGYSVHDQLVANAALQYIKLQVGFFCIVSHKFSGQTLNTINFFVFKATKTSTFCGSSATALQSRTHATMSLYMEYSA